MSKDKVQSALLPGVKPQLRYRPYFSVTMDKSVIDFCRRLFASSVSKDTMTYAQCRQSIGGKRRQSSYLIQRACKHLGRALFQCRICDHSTAALAGMSTHISRRHGFESSAGHFSDFSSDYAREIISAFEACFGDSVSNGAPEVPTVFKTSNKRCLILLPFSNQK